MAAINYGTVAVVPKGVWDSATQYNVANLVTYDGSSYLAHTKPPVGTLPTDTTYWQVSAQGTNKATADAIGVVKPDGETIAVDAAGTISAKKATESTFGIVSGGTGGVIVGSDGVMSVDTTFVQATELANIIAAEAFSVVLGKVSKAIATTMSLDENALLKSMLSSVDVNDTTKIPTSAYIHQLVERIGMGTDLDSGDNLTAAVNSLNSDLTLVELWRGNISAANTIINLNGNIDNYKTLYFILGSPSTPSQLGWCTVTLRRWYENGWQYYENGLIAFACPLGYMQLSVNSTTQMTLLHADNLLRCIHGSIK